MSQSNLTVVKGSNAVILMHENKKQSKLLLEDYKTLPMSVINTVITAIFGKVETTKNGKVNWAGFDEVKTLSKTQLLPVKSESAKDQTAAKIVEKVENAPKKSTTKEVAKVETKKTEVKQVEKKPKILVLDDDELFAKDLTLKKFMTRASQPVELVEIFDSKNKPIENYRGVQNNELKKVVSIVSDGYQLLPNKNAVEPVLEFLQKNKMKFELDNYTYLTDTRMRLHLTFPDIKIKDDTKEGILSSVFLHNSYDMTESLRIQAGAMRQVCSNGMIFGDVLKKVKVIHQAHDINEIMISELEAIFNGFYDNAKLIEQRIKDLREAKLTKGLLLDIQKKIGMPGLIKVLIDLKLANQDTRPAEVQEILDSVSDKKLQFDLWRVYNALTYWISHDMKLRWRMDFLQKTSKLFQL